MHKVLEEIKKTGIIPVIKIDDADKAVPLAKALLSGGINCAEVTFRTANAEEAIAKINREVPDILLGAGTVLTTEQADKAIASGAKFIVSPGFNPNVVSHCLKKGIPITPGCSNPSDMEMALEMGIETVKFFPAEQAGGLEYIKAISAPYTSLTFIPTGGINAQNIVKYMSFEKVIACGGSWMVNLDLIKNGEFDKISSLCREAVYNLLGFELIHMGINSEDEKIAHSTSNKFCDLFGFVKRETNAAIFSGTQFEIMKSMGRGSKGHIGIGTNSVFRARAFLEKQGMVFNDETARINDTGNLVFIYSKDEIGGFAIHLMLKN